MKQVVIDKLIELDHIYDRVDELSCLEHLEITAQKEGLECAGVIEIKGTGLLDQHECPIDEAIDLTIYAPFSKLSESEGFHVQLADSEFDLDGNQLRCRFTFEVTGIMEENSSVQMESEDGSIEDLLDDSQVVYETVRYVITSEHDTYATLSLKYQIQESVLRRLNHDKILNGRELILLPFS